MKSDSVALGWEHSKFSVLVLMHSHLILVSFQAKSLHILYEHASGFSLFRVKEFEKIGMLLPEVENSVTDLSRFNSIVSLVAFSPFKSGTNALDNINSISEGVKNITEFFWYANFVLRCPS